VKSTPDLCRKSLPFNCDVIYRGPRRDVSQPHDGERGAVGEPRPRVEGHEPDEVPDDQRAPLSATTTRKLVMFIQWNFQQSRLQVRKKAEKQKVR